MLLVAAGSMLKAQEYPKEYLGLPGDNLNLYAVMDLFRDSETIEGFERSLNEADHMVNNLDLNGDGYVDYILVRDYVEGHVHHIVLRVAIGKEDFQDVAVFIVEKLGDGNVRIQLIGDEALYGKNYIIEPNYPETPNPGYRGNTVAQSGNSSGTTVVTTTYYQVAAWPVVRYIYLPTYSVWHSPYYYGYYPSYWRPWRSHYWHYYYGYHSNWYGHYYSYYRPWPRHRYTGYHSYYHGRIRHRSSHVAVMTREGRYRTTYSRPEELSRGENRYHEVVAARGSGNAATTPGNRSSVSRRDADAAGNPGQAVRRGTPEDGATTTKRPAGNNTTTRQATPATRQATPATRQATPATRQATPATRQATPASTPSTRNSSAAPRSGNTRSKATPASTPSTRNNSAAPRSGNTRSKATPASTPSTRNNSAAPRSGNTRSKATPASTPSTRNSSAAPRSGNARSKATPASTPSTRNRSSAAPTTRNSGSRVGTSGSSRSSMSSPSNSRSQRSSSGSRSGSSSRQTPPSRSR
jgi:hypothetical protein